MGNLQQESGLNPSARNPNGATGLAQWMGGRYTALQNYASANGLSPNSLQAQLGYLWKELSSGGEGISPSQLNGLTASAAASLFESKFERSGGSAVANRENYANQFYSQFGKNTQGR